MESNRLTADWRGRCPGREVTAPYVFVGRSGAGDAGGQEPAWGRPYNLSGKPWDSERPFQGDRLPP